MSLNDRIRFTAGLGCADALQVWFALVQFLSERNCLPERVRLSQIAGHAESLKRRGDLDLTPHEVADIIQARQLRGFAVYVDRGAYEVKYHFAGFMYCQPSSRARCPDDWTRLIERVLTLQPSYGAWHYQARYCAWQGNSNAALFGSPRWGLLPPGSKISHVAHPYGAGPGWNEIDVSKNPGRCKLYGDERLPFLASAEMWLGPKFWAYAKCTKEEVLAADFILEKRDTPHFLYLRSWPTHFTRPDGEQGRIQQKIWKLFFNEEAEWPPGSGTICDEPMYGPPELMPNPPTAG